jgi:hypothetical protein
MTLGRSQQMKHRIGSATGRRITVGLIDSGVDPSAVFGRVAAGVDISAGAGRIQALLGCGDSTGHGTGCAKILFMVAPEATVLPVRVFSAANETSGDVVSAGIDWAVAAGARVLNLSLAAPEDSTWPILAPAVRAALEAGLIVVAADTRPAVAGAPACLPGVIAVRSGVVWGRSGFEVGFGEDGGGQVVLSSFARVNGRALSRSHATAYVSGVVARILETNDRATTGRILDWLGRISSPVLHPAVLLGAQAENSTWGTR